MSQNKRGRPPGVGKRLYLEPPDLDEDEMPNTVERHTAMLLHLIEEEAKIAGHPERDLYARKASDQHSIPTFVPFGRPEISVQSNADVD